ncbi:ABC transporter substrate-binding protein [Sneathiella sp. P13V-1]|uniref:MlaC/ttg2D family ABC transporter substrate-binding protein n=1 Tax=Sneathiella sp. P13V-1 TaxID=2697366 RepID=UPI00187BC3DE|nr:ABC transporter substrate-binding protein [Sneathiella sp. P13V-1]MBE7637220.1 ABC transporter substrate-binding protein [Sneathiella sp. P13V-1]
MLRFATLALSATFILASPAVDGVLSPAHAYAKEETKSATSLVNELGQEAVKLLANADLDETKKREGFTRLLERDFDMRLIGRFVLGKHWRNASKEEQEEYLALFQKYIVNTYQKRIGEYSGENLKIIKSQELNKKEELVNSQIVRPSGPPIKLDWRVRRKKSGELKIVDIIVENVSMALTHREEFSAVISSNGGKVSGLIEKLKSHIEEKS